MQRQLEHLQSDLYRSWEMEEEQLHHCARAMGYLSLSLPCYLSPQEWGSIIILNAMARSNLHCQNLEPVTSSNSTSATNKSINLLDGCGLRLLPLWFLSFTRMATLTGRPAQVRSGPHLPYPQPTPESDHASQASPFRLSIMPLTASSH